MENIMQMCLLDIAGRTTRVSNANPLDTLPEREMVKRISKATGLKFVYIADSNAPYSYYEAKIGKDKYSVHYSNYVDSVKGGARHISCNLTYHNGGSGCPCDSVDEAIATIKRWMEREV